MRDKLTIGIKTFCRPKVLDWNLSQWINLNLFKNINVIIADDSFKEYKKKNKIIIQKYKLLNNNINYLDISENTGLSFGRNEIVKNCNTKYILIIDDSRSFNLQTNIPKMLNFLEELNYDLVAGKISERNKIHSHYTGIIKKISHKNNIPNVFLRKLEHSERIKYSKLKIFKTHICLNVFIAKTDILKKFKWKDELKMGEHELFFYILYKNNIKCFFSPDCNFLQCSKLIKQYDKNIRKYRLRGEILKKKYVNYIFTNPSDGKTSYTSRSLRGRGHRGRGRSHRGRSNLVRTRSGRIVKVIVKF